MGSDESHFNVSVGSDGQSHNWDSVRKPQPFWRERRAEAVSNRGPSAYQPNALPLGQTGSQVDVLKDRNKYCLQVRACFFRPGKVTCWGSEGVKVKEAIGSHSSYKYDSRELYYSL